MDPYVLGLSDPLIICTNPDLFHQQVNNYEKNLISILLWLRNDLLSLETDVYVPTVVSKKQKNVEEKKKLFFVSLCEKGRIRSRVQIRYPVYGFKDQYQNVRDRNTAFLYKTSVVLIPGFLVPFYPEQWTYLWTRRFPGGLSSQHGAGTRGRPGQRRRAFLR